MNYINTEQSNVEFTLELGKNYFFSFLDVIITASNNQLVTSVFHMATFSSVFYQL